MCVTAYRFLAGDDKEAELRRSSMFKLIPSVVKGSWVIKQAVGNTPVLLGKKLTTKYFRYCCASKKHSMCTASVLIEFKMMPTCREDSRQSMPF